MPPVLRDEILRAKDADGGISRFCVDVYVMTAASGLIEFHWSSSNFEVQDHLDREILPNRINFENLLKSMGTITHNKDKGVDDTEFVLFNHLDLSQVLLNEDDFSFEGATCVVSKAYLDIQTYQDDGEAKFYSDERLRGFITSFVPTFEEIKVGVQGDMTAKGRTVAARPIFESCPLRFNAGGLLSASVDPCGWQTSQGLEAGALNDSCDHTPYGANGCSAHHNLYRCGAYAQISSGFTNAVLLTSGDNGWENRDLIHIIRHRDYLDHQVI